MQADKMSCYEPQAPAPGEPRLLDACALDSLGFGMPVSNQVTDPSSFFVGEIDATTTEPMSSLGIFEPALELGGIADDLEIPGIDVPLTLNDQCPVSLPWTACPSIPEHGELFIHQQREPSMSTSHMLSNGLSQVPRVASMPNLSSNGDNVMNHSIMVPSNAGNGYYVHNDEMKEETSTCSAKPSLRFPRSRSANDISDLSKYSVPHSEFLTPPHLRKGKGGRQPAADPRLDPKIDPKKARRILANRLSAAKSKLKQKSAAEGMKQRLEMLKLQKQGLVSEVSKYEEACMVEETERERLQDQIRMVEKELKARSNFGGFWGPERTANAKSAAAIPSSFIPLMA